MTTTYPVDLSQRRAAKVIGVLYLLLMATGVFAQIYVPGHFPGNGGGGDRALLGNELLYRLA
jgi:hypothetical protein